METHRGPRLAETGICPYNRAEEHALSTTVGEQPDTMRATAGHLEKLSPLTKLASFVFIVTWNRAP
jgi:hypothetical protein